VLGAAVEAVEVRMIAVLSGTASMFPPAAMRRPLPTIRFWASEPPGVCAGADRRCHRRIYLRLREPSLAFGDGYTANVSGTYGDQDNNHIALLDRDAESDTDHAQYRQY
jgi:hypothetical protein